MIPSAMQEYSKIHEFEYWVILTMGLVFCLKFAKVSIVLRVYHTIKKFINLPNRRMPEMTKDCSLNFDGK